MSEWRLRTGEKEQEKTCSELYSEIKYIAALLRALICSTLLFANKWSCEYAQLNATGAVLWS